MNDNKIPNVTHSLTPHIVCRDAAAAIEFYRKAFGAEEQVRMPAQDGSGKLMHAMVRIGDAQVMLCDEYPEWDSLGPLSRNGTSVTLHLNVADVDAAFQRALDAGAKTKMPVTDMFWGDRYGVLTDPFGHEWSLATHLRDLSVEEAIEASKHQICNPGGTQQ
ncbi:VOC family protein [Pseudoduganella chitinolytica]|uniref:VOC family protein n=1 Tax=Pseudoduganella chitinolytica TaxID=34070 RepID=A0ABY8BE95_9BURK|nr:VOC family protein [Pseudoduganella chitinolytica]WEF33713.1 VOC family protein [Pseudoduganella chitinolytica]